MPTTTIAGRDVVVTARRGAERDRKADPDGRRTDRETGKLPLRRKRRSHRFPLDNRVLLWAHGLPSTGKPCQPP